MDVNPDNIININRTYRVFAAVLSCRAAIAFYEMLHLFSVVIDKQHCSSLSMTVYSTLLLLLTVSKWNIPVLGTRAKLYSED